MARCALLLVVCLSLGLSVGPAQSMGARPEVQVSTVTLTIPTYNYADFLILEHSNVYNMDYYRLDWGAYEASGPHTIPHDYTAVVVENPWLRLTFLPELGGRLYGVTDKTTGDELLYQNPVIKPTHWGPSEQGWWLAAGGIEWCLPVEEHGYESGVPWGYDVETTPQGATVTLWNTIAEDRVRARITVHLPADRAAFTISPRLENPSTNAVTLKYWHNALLAPGAINWVGQHLHFVFPIDEVTVHSRGDPWLPDAGQAMSWPVYGGTDYSRLGNWNQWLGFFARPHAAEGWAGVYGESQLRGVARIFPPEVARGVKGFAMGWTNPISPINWTDDGSTYVELHAGPSPTFWDSITLVPGGALEWTETWLPVRDLPRLTMATAEAALGVMATGADLEVGVVPAAQMSDGSLWLWRAAGCEPLWRADGLSVAPGEAYTELVAGVGVPAEEVVLGALEGGRLLALSGMLDCQEPASAVAALEPTQAAADFAVAWAADDPGGVAARFDVEVRDGDAGAAWTRWLTGTTETTAVFHGELGHTYTFRSRVQDMWGRVEAWPAGEWADTFTTVVGEPAPVLITSAKRAWPRCPAPGAEVEYRIEVNNTGNLTATVSVTDPLPAGLEMVGAPWITPTLPAPVEVSGTITWQGELAARQTGVTIGWTATVTGTAPGQAVVNAAWLDDGVHAALEREAVVGGCRRLYVPLVMKVG